MKHLKIVFAVLSLVLAGYSIYAGYCTAGLKLLYTDSRLGWILSWTFRPAVIAAVLSITTFAVLLVTGRKAAGTKDGQTK